MPTCRPVGVGRQPLYFMLLYCVESDVILVQCRELRGVQHVIGLASSQEVQRPRATEFGSENAGYRMRSRTTLRACRGISNNHVQISDTRRRDLGSHARPRPRPRPGSPSCSGFIHSPMATFYAVILVSLLCPLPRTPHCREDTVRHPGSPPCLLAHTQEMIERKMSLAAILTSQSGTSFIISLSLANAA